MKILTVLSLISSEGYFGAETMLVTLAQNLSRFDCHCIVGVLSDRRFPKTGVAEQAQRYGLSVETVWCDGRADWKAVKRIRNLLVQHNVDILNSHGYKADLYAFAAASANRVALVATSHNWPSKLLIMRAYAAIDRLVLGRFDKVICVSDVPSDILRRWGVAPGKVSTIFNGVDIDRFDGAVPTLRNEIVSDGDSLVGFVGRLVPDKGGSLLLRAAQQVLAVRPKTVFVLVGEGSARKEWEALAKQ